MSLTYQQIISDALVELGRLGDGQEANARQGQQGLRALNAMMAELREKDQDFNWYEVTLADIGETAPLPDWSLDAVTFMLAVKLAPRVRAPVTPELGALAANGAELIGRTFINQALDGNLDMTHMPQGTGKYGIGGRYDIETDQSV